MRKEHQYYVYIMSNYQRTTLYTGCTNNLIRRVIEHKYEIGSEFTKKYKTKYLMYYELYQYIHGAIEREKEIKGWTRAKKLELIKSVNLEMKDLSKEMFEEHGITEDDIQAIVEELSEYYKNKTLSF